MLLRLLLLLSCLFFLPQQLMAHKIHVFAWVSGNTVTVESNFSADRPLRNGAVTVKDQKSDRVLLQGKGNEKGIFTFTIPDSARKEAMDLLIVVAGSEGHQNQWLIPAGEYLPDHLPSAAPPQPTTQHKSAPAAIDREELQQMLQDLLEQELAPIRRSLARAEERKPGFQDIMGGIGYLLGLAGLVAWLRNRNPQEPSPK